MSNLFLARQHPVWYHNSQDHKTICLHEIEIQIYTKYGVLIGRNNRLDTKLNWVLLFVHKAVNIHSEKVHL